MNRLFELLAAYRNSLLFWALLVVALVLLVRFSNPHQALFSAGMLEVTSSINAVQADVSDYFSLRDENRRLSAEVARLLQENAQVQDELHYYRNRLPARQRFLAYYSLPDSAPDSLKATLMPRRPLRFRPARVVGNSILNAYNYLTLNIGRKHGVHPGLGVVAPDGVAGIVVYTSPNYSVALSLLNKRTQVSCLIKTKRIMGSLGWDGKDSRFATLEYVPLHYTPNIGDTVVTSHLSERFPEGILIGTIDRIEESENNGFYGIRVRLACDFNRLDYVYVIENDDTPELDTLKSLIRK